jgi:flagellar hook-length control protein FliK
MTTTPAESTKKPVPAGLAAPAPIAENSTPVNETAPANTNPNLKAAPVEASKSDDAKVQAQGKLQANPQAKGDSTKADSANTNANPTTAGANGQPAKNDGTKSEGETANGTLSTPQNKSLASHRSLSHPVDRRFSGDKDPRRQHATLNSAMQAPQVIAPALTVTAPTVAAAAAIPLAALPVTIAAHAKDGINRFEIGLDPPELGRIDVRLDIDRSGHVTSRLMVERPETLDLLRRDAPQIDARSGRRPQNQRPEHADSRCAIKLSPIKMIHCRLRQVSCCRRTTSSAKQCDRATDASSGSAAASISGCKENHGNRPLRQSRCSSSDKLSH